MRMYSPFFDTLYDERSPTGSLGRGTHYSVLRAVVFTDRFGGRFDYPDKTVPVAKYCDFGIIWDEDHDERVIEPIEAIYQAGRLSAFLMFGERKGSFTAILDGYDYDGHNALALHKLINKAASFVDGGDSWPAETGTLGHPSGIISDEEKKVALYLANVNMLWQLGLKDARRVSRVPKVIVHHYEVYDHGLGNRVPIAGVKATAEHIAGRDGKIIPGTAESVELSKLNDVGQYRAGS